MARRWPSYDDIRISRDSLIEFAWSAPMRTLAAQIGMSDVGLKKMLASYDVFPPPQGYWNKIAAGKPVPKRPAAPDRKPGETHYASVDKRLGAFIPIAPLPDHKGPFASKFVPENLDDLYQDELKAIGTVKASRDLSNPHRDIRAFLQSEEKRRAKKQASEYSWTDGALFDNPFDKRRLRILNGLFHGLEKRGVAGRLYDRDAELHISAIVGDMGVGISLEPATPKRSYGYSRLSRYADLPANTKMKLVVRHHYKSGDSRAWTDTDKATIEQSLNEIAASIIMLGEAAYRRSLQERAERMEEEKRRREAERQKRLKEAEAERLAQLRKSGELLRQAEEIRSLITLVKDASASLNMSAADIDEWEQWAGDYADRIDPVKSRQVLLHLRPPTLDDD